VGVAILPIREGGAKLEMRPKGQYFDVTVIHNSDTDQQPEVAALSHPDVATVEGIDTDRVRVTLMAGADADAYEAVLEVDPGVKRFVIQG
jgi:hypothetical protein